MNTTYARWIALSTALLLSCPGSTFGQEPEAGQATEDAENEPSSGGSSKQPVPSDEADGSERIEESATEPNKAPNPTDAEADQAEDADQAADADQPADAGEAARAAQNAEEAEEAEPLMMPEVGAAPSPDEAQLPAEVDPAAPSDGAKKENTGTSDALEAADIVVTGDRLERKIEDAPVRTQVIDREAIEQRRARTLSDAMEYTTGVRVENNCQNCGFQQLRLNGLDGAYTQVLIDGLPSFSGLASVYGLEQIPVEMIDRVEIVKGGGSALYGPSAVAGVVNIITRRPIEDFTTVDVSYESVALEAPDLRLSANSGFVSDDGDTAAHVFFATRRRDAVDLNDDSFTEIVRMRSFTAGTNLFFTPIDDGELRLSFHTLQEYRRGGDNLDLPPHDAAVAEEIQTQRYQGEIRWEHRLSRHVSYELAYVLAYTDRRSYYGGGGDAVVDLPAPGEPVTDDVADAFEARRVALGGYGETDNPLHVADAHVDFEYEAAGQQVVTVGAQANIDDVTDRYLAYDREIDDTFSVFGAYLQHAWVFASWGESLVGARVDKHSELDAPIVSPRAALRFRPISWLNLRSAVATGFRAPQAFDEDLHIETVGGAARLIVNDENLEPERSLTFAQQIQTVFELPGNRDLRLGVNGYLSRLQNAFVLNERDNPDTPEEELIRENRGTTTVVGSELAAEVNSRYWALRMGWTFERATNEEADEDFGETQIFRTPNNYGYADLVLRRAGFQAQTGVEITGPMLAPRYDANADPLEVNETPWFFDWSVNVGYAVALSDGYVVEPYLGARNILDSRQTDFDRGPDRDASYIYGPTLPRTVLAGVRGQL